MCSSCVACLSVANVKRASGQAETNNVGGSQHRSWSAQVDKNLKALLLDEHPQEVGLRDRQCRVLTFRRAQETGQYYSDTLWPSLIDRSFVACGLRSDGLDRGLRHPDETRELATKARILKTGTYNETCQEADWYAKRRLLPGKWLNFRAPLPESTFKRPHRRCSTVSNLTYNT